ncbi:MAG: GtrA family protein [Ottowia sp.]|nr:GtrA family protein [Ottowia sp.]
MKKLLDRVTNKQIRYLVVGGWNTGCGYLISLGLYYGLAHRLHIIVIGVIANIICITMSFLTYKTLVFQTRGNWVSEYLRCHMVYGGNAVLSIIGLWLLVGQLNVPFWLAQGGVMIAGVIISYLGHSLFTFRKQTTRED